jgi:ribosomal protein L7/L12
VAGVTISVVALLGGAIGLLLLGFVLGSRLREGRDLMGPPGQGPGMPTIKPTYVRSPAPASQSTQTAVSPDSQSAIAAALRNGNKIEAIKLYRSATGADLKSSKDAVEAMEA